MKQRYRLFRRGWGTWYSQDTTTGKQTSLGTRNKQEAERIIHATNEAHRQPMINFQIGRAYLSATDPSALTRTWQFVMNEMARQKKNPVTRQRWERGTAQQAFDLIRNQAVIETRPEHVLEVLRTGTVCTNVFLRRLHNFALDMNWLPCSIIPRRQWPKIKFAEKRAITLDEHQRIVAGESNPELRAFYQSLWHLGGSQTDIANLSAEDINWRDGTISYNRQKTGSHAVIQIGETMTALLRSRPSSGLLFPTISKWVESDRAKAFSRRCRLVGVSGVSLHSYRYSWAERARIAAYPQRYAQAALGHKSKAVHEAYAKKAEMRLPSLESYEQRQQIENLIPVEFQAKPSVANPVESVAVY